MTDTWPPALPIWAVILIIGASVLLAAIMVMTTTKYQPVNKIDISGAIQITKKPEDAPRFKRLYNVKLNNSASMTITIYTLWKGRRTRSGELTQPNGRWVLFDPDAVAEKILDPLLVPLIEQWVKKIYALDDEFTRSSPSFETASHDH